MIRIVVQEADFDTAALIAELEMLDGGAVASFTGLVRGEGGLIDLTLDHYPAMTEKALAAIADQAAARWPLGGIVIVHRVGAMPPGARIVFVGTAAKHRAAALEACAFLIDWLKSEAPFWKKERFSDGRAGWVEPRAGDAAAKARWHS